VVSILRARALKNIVQRNVEGRLENKKLLELKRTVYGVIRNFLFFLLKDIENFVALVVQINIMLSLKERRDLLRKF